MPEIKQDKSLRNASPETLERELAKATTKLAKETKLETRAMGALSKEYRTSDNYDKKVERQGGEIDFNTNHYSRTQDLGKDVKALQDDVAENRAALRAVKNLREQAQEALQHGHRIEAAARLRDALGRVKNETGDAFVSAEGAKFLKEKKILK